MQYTPAQTRWWIEAIDQAERDAHRAQVMAGRAAQATDKALAEYFKQIQTRD